MNNERYIRQISLPQVGKNGQLKLADAKVLVIGAGGLGNAVLPYLASSGIGTIGIIDGDTIAKSNLHRQVLFSENVIGNSKSKTASEKLQAQFSDVNITSYNEFLTAENALTIIKKYDIIVDATDTIEVRYLINDACVLTGKPFVHSSVYRFQFQISTFNFEGSGTYRCLYPNPPKTVQSCSEAGVMPTTVAMAGMYQANEVLKFVLGIGELITDKMLLVDTLTNKQHSFSYAKKDTSIVTEAFFAETHQQEKIEYLTFNEAQKLGGLFLDVRNPNELPKLSFEAYEQVPISEIENRREIIENEQAIFVFCQSGKRSQQAYQLLKNKHNTVYCLRENAPEIHQYFEYEI